MCGRFALATEKRLLEMLYQLEIRADLLNPRFNIAPSQDILALRLSPADGTRELVFLHWGLVPSWAEDRRAGSRLINARSETAAQKPSFRSAFRKRRLLIPVSGFFEWKKEKEGKQPYYVQRKDGFPFSLAGLWERWEKGTEPLESCTILTTEPNELLAPLHNRMPLILAPEAYGPWLDPASSAQTLAPLLEPCGPDELQAFPVSRRVNSPANDSPDLVEPL